MAKKLPLLVLALALASLGIWFATRTPDRAGGLGLRDLGTSEPAQVDSTPLTAVESTPGLRSAVAAPRTELAAPPVRSARPRDERLAGLVGRVVESDGTPVSGMRVALIEVDVALILSGDFSLGGPDGLPLHRDGTVTDDEGRFELSGASEAALQALGLDLGGMRAGIRVVDQGLVNGVQKDVGDIVLAPWAVLAGRVVDEGGAPVAGARVRVAPAPEEVFEIRIQDIGAETVFHADQNGLEFLIEMPGRYAALLESLPIPTLETGADGTFRFEGISPGKGVLAITRAGYPSTTVGDLDVLPGENDLGDLVLTRGRSLSGVVRDGRGEVVAGAEVLAGAEVPAGEVSLLHPAGTTDAEGRFAARGLPLEGTLRVAARRDRGEHWVTAEAVDGVEALVDLPARHRLTVLLRRITGEPVAGAQIQFERLAMPRSIPFSGMFTPWLEGQSGGELVETEPGTYVAEALPAGDYQLKTHPEGFASLTEGVAVEDWDTEEVLVVDPGQTVTVLVVDELTQAPVERATVRIAQTTFFGFTGLVAGETGKDGRVTLGPFSEPEEGEELTMGFFGSDFEPVLQAVVDHPSYPRTMIELDGEEVVVPLPPGGVLRGRVHLAGESPFALYTIAAVPQGENSMGVRRAEIPRLTLTAPDGSFAFAHLEGGEWEVNVMERFLDRDPLGLARDEVEPRRLGKEEAEVEAGQTTELEIDLGPTGLGPTGILRGTVRIDGLPYEGARVRVWGGGERKVETDRWGTFELLDVSTLSGLYVRIDADVGPDDSSVSLFSEGVDLEEGEVHEMEVDVHRRRVAIHVTEEGTGRPLEGARVSTDRRRGGRQTTDRDGRAELVVIGEDDVRITADLDGYAKDTKTISIADGAELGTVELALGSSVPFSGTVDLSAARDGDTPVQWAWITARPKGGGARESQGLPGDTGKFSFDDLKPGTYEISLWVNGQSGEVVEVELPPGGRTDVEIVFTPEPEEE